MGITSFTVLFDVNFHPITLLIDAVNCLNSIGFKIMSFAPSRKDFWAYSNDSNAVITINFVSLTAFITSNPSTTGIFMSRKTSWGFNFFISSIPSSPLFAVPIISKGRFSFLTKYNKGNLTEKFAATDHSYSNKRIWLAQTVAEFLDEVINEK